MADTRCANPEYQLDVDVMILEYELYRAIASSLKALEPTSRLRRKEDSTWQSAKKIADQAVGNFDILIKLFHRNHPDFVLSEGTEYNIKILEFLVLFSSWLDGCIQQGADPDNSLKTDDIPQRLRYERIVNRELRRLWIRNHQHEGDPHSEQFQRASTVQDHQSLPMRHFSLQDLIPRFLDLSAEVANCMGDVNAQWFQLAAEFMLQCALERMQWLISISKLDRPTTPDQAPDDHPTWLAECFAWGATPSAPSAHSLLQSCSIPIESDTLFSAHQMLRTEQHIADLFTTQSADDMSVEDPTWTALRRQHQSRVHHQLASPEPEPQSLQIQHPQHEFLADLLDFVDGLWRLNMGTINEKPVLVQIEEGGITGLSRDEFTEFLGRVGLTMDRKLGATQIRWSVPGERKRARDEAE